MCVINDYYVWGFNFILLVLYFLSGPRTWVYDRIPATYVAVFTDEALHKLSQDLDQFLLLLLGVLRPCDEGVVTQHGLDLLELLELDAALL
jgi:hypothetical protein